MMDGRHKWMLQLNSTQDVEFYPNGVLFCAILTCYSTAYAPDLLEGWSPLTRGRVD